MEVLHLDSLPLGFRFRPTDVELVDHYLRLKINGNDNEVRVIREIDVCKLEPWDLPDLSVVRTNDPEWFFFCPVDRKYPNGHRLNRATKAGYWKATGKDRKIKSGTNLIGMKKTLVFHKGRAPKGKRTRWVMHEYRTTLAELDGTHPGQGAFVLCRLFKKNDETLDNSTSDDAEAGPSSPAANASPEETGSELATIQESPPLLTKDKHASDEDMAQGENFLEGWHIVPPFPAPPIQIKAEQQSPAPEPAVNTEPNDDAYMEFFDSIFNNDCDFSCDFDMPDCGTGTEVGNDLIVAEAAEPSGKQFQCMSEDHGQSDRNVYNQNEHSVPRESNMLSSQEAVDENNRGTEDGAITATGIRLRPRASDVPPPWFDPSAQGTAFRRMRLERKIQIGPISYCAQFVKPHFDEVEDSSSKSEITELKEPEEEEDKTSTEPVSRKPCGTATNEIKQEEAEVLQEFSVNKMQDSRSSSEVSPFQKVHTVKLVRSKVTLLRVFAMLAFFICLLGVRKYVKFFFGVMV